MYVRACELHLKLDWQKRNPEVLHENTGGEFLNIMGTS